MIELDQRKYAGLLRRKVELLRERVPAISRSTFGLSALIVLDQMEQGLQRCTLAGFKDVDSDLEARGVACIGRPAVDKLVEDLVREMGVGRIAADPRLVARRVLKRGRMRDEEEYYCIRDMLTNERAVEFLTGQERARLEGIASKQGA